jgi:hypothetical protein
MSNTFLGSFADTKIITESKVGDKNYYHYQ